MSDADKTSEELDFWAIYDDMQKMSEVSISSFLAILCQNVYSPDFLT